MNFAVDENQTDQLRMAENSTIEWTDHTFNPWWGCTKVSPACKHCYAEAWAKRVGATVWGPESGRRFFTDKHWGEPLKWDASARESGVRARVFCASMSDVFEGRKELTSHRGRLWKLIGCTPNLDWLLLTKRPHNVRRMVPWGEHWPSNVWLGTTVETQSWAVKRIPALVENPAKTRFLSCEPLLGELDLSAWDGIDWIIAGGESGANARPMNPLWVRNLRDQCEKRGIAFHFKQWGHWAPESQVGPSNKILDMTVVGRDTVRMAAVGKKRGGRILDGVTWNELPRNER